MGSRVDFGLGSEHRAPKDLLFQIQHENGGVKFTFTGSVADLENALSHILLKHPTLIKVFENALWDVHYVLEVNKRGDPTFDEFLPTHLHVSKPAQSKRRD